MTTCAILCLCFRSPIFHLVPLGGVILDVIWGGLCSAKLLVLRCLLGLYSITEVSTKKHTISGVLFQSTCIKCIITTISMYNYTLSDGSKPWYKTVNIEIAWNSCCLWVLLSSKAFPAMSKTKVLKKKKTISMDYHHVQYYNGHKMWGLTRFSYTPT